METNITINKLELASELAHRKLLNHASITIYENDDSDVLTYTEEAQDIFNEYYDQYLTMIESCKTEHEEKIKAVRNYDADYFVNENGEECNNGNIKRYAIEIQNEAGDAIDYISENSENNATDKINEINKSNKY